MEGHSLESQAAYDFAKQSSSNYLKRGQKERFVVFFRELLRRHDALGGDLA